VLTYDDVNCHNERMITSVSKLMRSKAKEWAHAHAWNQPTDSGGQLTDDMAVQSLCARLL